MTAIVDPQRCTASGECVEACPLDAIQIADQHATVDADVCGDCGACVEVCPQQAIELS